VTSVYGQCSTSHTAFCSLYANCYSMPYDANSQGYISDGGGDTYDGGNYFAVNSVSIPSYGDNWQSMNYGGQSFVMDLDTSSMFVVTTASGTAVWQISGNVGADGGGSRVSQTYNSGPAYGYRGTVCGVGDPSVNHMWVSTSSTGWDLCAGTNTNDDCDRFTLPSGQNLVIAVYWSTANTCITSSEHNNIFLSMTGMACAAGCASSPTYTGYTVAGGGTSAGNTRTVSCATGYTGSSGAISCQSNGSWTTPSGCSPVNCGTPVASAGYALGSGSTTYGSTYSMTCATGYTGTAASLTCQSSATWTAQSGCTIRNCGTPTAATGYVLASGGTTYGSTRVVSCATGYAGAPPAISCTSGGTWESQTGCTFGCGVPTSIFPGYTFSGSSSTPGTVLTATGCATGYNGASSSTITCATGSGGVNAWSTPTGCSPNDCGVPSIRGYTVATGENYFPTRRTTTCATGWSGSSPTAIQCNADSLAASGASWSTPTGCTINDCGQPGAIEGYIFATPVSTTYESTTDMICAEGYWGPSSDLEYAGSISCQADRLWTTPDTCTMVDCGQPVFPGYVYNETSTTTWQAVVRHDSCEAEGYVVVGTNTSECLADGIWSAPSGCQPVECGVPVMELGYEAGEGLSYFGGGGVAYTCSSGYNGPAGTLTCQANGNWSPLSGCNMDSSANSLVFFSAASTAETAMFASALVTFFAF